MGRRDLIVMCDGTSNEINTRLSNVLKLFRMIQRRDYVRVFYDPGIGTIGDDTPWRRARQRTRAVFELATGYGLDANIADAYAWLCNNWRGEEDRIWLFGYSRGAYTARALAGLVHMLGIMQADQANLTGYSVKAYRRMSETGDFEVTDHFRKVMRARRATIHFIGVWDTVASIIVPGWRKLTLATLEHLPFTQKNPSVAHFRQALAIDERRRLFRPRLWIEPQEFIANPFDLAGRLQQSVKQVWFAGSHGDIGGGRLESESGLSKIPLLWMAEEAIGVGLPVHTQSLNRIARGQVYPGDTRLHAAPDPAADLYRSDKGGWQIPEWLPKRAARREWPDRKPAAGIYLPRGEPRFIPAQSMVHSSVKDRMAIVPDYRPVNLPANPVWV